MATGKGSRPDDMSLFERLAKDPEKHHIFQALRVIEAHYSDAPRLGESRRPREDKVRLGQEAELAFPPSSIADFQPGKSGHFLRNGVLFSIKTGGGLTRGPGPVKQAHHAVGQHIGKRHKGRVTVVTQAVAGVSGQMQRQRALRAKQAKETVGQTGGFAIFAGLKIGDGRGRKGQFGLLTQTHFVFTRPAAFAQTGRVKIMRFDHPQGLKNVVFFRVFGEPCKMAQIIRPRPFPVAIWQFPHVCALSKRFQ